MFLAIILIAYLSMVIKNYYILPLLSDNVWYVRMVDAPFKNAKLFDRYFDFYTAKVLFCSFMTPLKGCALFSLLCHAGIVAFSYLSVQRIAGRTSAIMAAILAATMPVMLYQATQYGPDAPCLLFGLAAVYFSLSVHVGSRYQTLEQFLAGFFLLGAIFSKLPGVAFVIPVIMILAPKLPKEKYWYFIGGMASTLLFIAFCDKLWLGDFFYHIDPRSYLSVSGWFGGDLGESIAQSRVEWGNTLVETLLREGKMQYFIFITVYLTLLSFPGDQELQKRKYISFSVFMIAVIGLLLHEGMHVVDAVLNIHDRWTYILTLPFLLSFCCLLPIEDSKKEAHHFTSSFYFDAAFTFIFVFLLFITNRRFSYYSELAARWSMLNSFIHVFSLWVFLFGLGLMLFFGVRSFLGNRSLFNSAIAYLGLVLIVWCSATLGNIVAREHSISLFAHESANLKLSNIIKEKIDKMAVFDVHSNKFAEDAFYRMYLDNAINKYNIDRIMSRSEEVNKYIYRILIGNSYKYLLAPGKYGLKYLNDNGRQYGISFKEINEIENMYLYEINKRERI